MFCVCMYVLVEKGVLFMFVLVDEKGCLCLCLWVKKGVLFLFVLVGEKRCFVYVCVSG